MNALLVITFHFQLFFLCLDSVHCAFEDNIVDHTITKITFDQLKTRPNFVVIFADDMGWGDVGANWPKTVDTPNLDWMAANGIRLTDFHAGASVCSPSRSSLLTGRLGIRTGVVKNFAADAAGGIPKNETTVAEVLKQAGYITAMLGKWHLGMTNGHHPLDKGFDSYLGVPFSVDMACCDTPGSNIPPCPPCPVGNDLGNSIDDSYECSESLALPLYSDRKILHQPTDLNVLSSNYAQFAKNFIMTSSLQRKPYFLYAALSHIHVPLAHAPRFNNITGHGVFADTLREMDWLVGEIIKYIHKSQSSNTLVLFTSDNGPWLLKCDLAGSVGPFTGDWQRDLQLGGGGSFAKQTVWEAGHRVPAIFYWPGFVEPGTTSDVLMSTLDILPTFAFLAGAPLPDNRIFDGINMAKAIVNHSKTGHKVLFHPNSGASGVDGEIGAVRYGHYKAVYETGGSPDCSGKVGPSMSFKKKPLIFNLADDPTEGKLITGEKYKIILKAINEALDDFLVSVKRDNTSTADYSQKKSSRPCCNTENTICRCSWD